MFKMFTHFFKPLFSQTNIGIYLGIIELKLYDGPFSKEHIEQY